ncbi:MAG: TIGR04282 family arsenosugar biosynthesis glycosyltransferase [Hyphomicrobiaceae bacterium]
MVRLPVAGRVKTRLARGVGTVAATMFYRHAASALIERLSRDRRWSTVLAVTPDRAVGSRSWPPGSRRMRQGGGDLGERMQRVFEAFPPGPAIIIGSDSPAITTGHLARAFRALGQADAVLGPAPDGGYWMVGLRRSGRMPRPFAGVRWSSATTLDDTLANLAGWRVAMVEELDDIDDAESLVRSGGHHGRYVPPRGLRGAGE